MTKLSKEWGKKMYLSWYAKLVILSFLGSEIIWKTKGVIQIPKNVTFPALLVFGDSIVDTGNNNYLNTLVKCNFPPYGKDFRGGVPTGRFNDGKVPSDLIAEELGIKELVPAYLDPKLKPEDLLTGVTFASGGTGYDNLTATIANVLSLSKQLEYFKEYKHKLRAIVGKERAEFIVRNSVYILSSGSNDIASTYFLLPLRRLHYDVPTYTDLMLNSASSFLNELYLLGARRIGVFSAPPIGCVPSQRTFAGGHRRLCSKKSNDAALLFNSKLSAKLNSLSTTLRDSKIIYIDVYSPLLDIIQHPKKYGFQEANRGCCGTGTVEVAVFCNRVSLSLCQNRSNYVFFDTYHPSERTYRVIVSELISKYIPKFF